MKKLAYILLFAGGISCDAPTEESRYEGETEEEMVNREELVLDNTFSTWMHYEGLLPCADCEGIRTVLKLENSPDKKERAYELTETYLGTEDGDREFVSQGIYEVVYGLENNPGAMAIRLLDENSAAVKSFRQDEFGTLHLLDGEEQAIVSDLNYSLELVEQ
ncbi:copper resistance protein NlpE N-terminal domain-containing protein [Cyclobacterium roseum]|uniref:copper resistance protein NlpE N-terminal domain-containing protein n=1 Tax=Cyclobacterium roseum TaxID=2666137 RepID=UPI0013918B1D|nr:copper resistance protein NlpE N-terminal domain-containing protein [Cyclobacterium roseum]